jgi:hypothetical protein
MLWWKITLGYQEVEKRTIFVSFNRRTSNMRTPFRVVITMKYLKVKHNILHAQTTLFSPICTTIIITKNMNKKNNEGQNGAYSSIEPLNSSKGEVPSTIQFLLHKRKQLLTIRKKKPAQNKRYK